MRLRMILGFGTAISMTSATPVQAQYYHQIVADVIAQTIMMNSGPGYCGKMSDKEIAEARVPAPDVMQSYFDAAQNGGSKTAAFRISKKSQWVLGDTVVTYDQIDAQVDPLALAGNRLEREPLRFFRAGNHITALGQWAVVNEAGDAVGVYDGLFKRQKREWKLHKLTAYGASDSVAPAMQYCAEPQDTVNSAVESSNQYVEYLEGRITKNETKLAKAQSKLEASEVKLAQKPKSSSLKKRVIRDKKKVEQRKDKLGKIKEQLESALERQVKSQRDADEIKAMTVPASQALQFKDFELTSEKEAAAKKAEEEAKKAGKN